MAYSRVEVDEATGAETVIYGASGLGACPVALYYDRQGVTGEPTPEWLQKAYDQGNDNEQRILDMFQSRMPFTLLTPEECIEAGYSLGEYDEDRQVDYSRQVRVESTVLPFVKIRAHLDGIARLNKPQGWTREQDLDGELFVVEVKALSDALWSAWKTKGIGIVANYPWQVSAQMKGAGIRCVFVVGHKNKEGQVFEIDYRFVDELPVKWIEVIKKINTIEKGEIEESDCPTPLMYPCPYYQLHNPEAVTVGKGEGRVKVEPEDTERALLISLGEEYERHKIAEKHHKELKEKASKEIAAWFDSKGAKGGETSVGAWSIKDTIVPKPGALNGDKILAKYPDVDLDSLRGNGYEVRYPIVTRTDGGKVGKG